MICDLEYLCEDYIFDLVSEIGFTFCHSLNYISDGRWVAEEIMKFGLFENPVGIISIEQGCPTFCVSGP